MLVLILVLKRWTSMLVRRRTQAHLLHGQAALWCLGHGVPPLSNFWHRERACRLSQARLRADYLAGLHTSAGTCKLFRGKTHWVVWIGRQASPPHQHCLTSTLVWMNLRHPLLQRRQGMPGGRRQPLSRMLRW